jgi:predicted RNA binding protein YcfA (HicA-like mRNA interferase family)
LQALGFEERIRGSHHTYRKKGIEEKINIQKDGSKAKPYQVRQIRSILLRYKIVGEE